MLSIQKFVIVMKSVDQLHLMIVEIVDKTLVMIVETFTIVDSVVKHHQQFFLMDSLKMYYNSYPVRNSNIFMPNNLTV